MVKLKPILQQNANTMNSFYVYLMASKRHGTLYTGSTSDLIKRTWEHKNQVTPGFTAKYNVSMLIYYEIIRPIEFL